MYFVIVLSCATLESGGLFQCDRVTRVGAFQGREAEFEGSEVVPGSMVGLTVILDGAKEFAHRPLESRLEP